MIRTAHPDDADFVSSLAHQFDVFGGFYAGHFDREFAADPSEFFICEGDAGAKLGFAKILIEGNSLDIQGVAVDPASRRQGVASALINHIVSVARERGVTRLKCITAETENPPALACFMNNGFRSEGLAGHYPRGQRAVNLTRGPV